MTGDPQALRARVDRPEAFFHRARPVTAQSPELCNFLEEIDVRRRDPGDAGSDLIDGHAARNQILHRLVDHRHPHGNLTGRGKTRSEEHTSELQSLMRNSYAVFCLKKKNTYTTQNE